MVSTCGSSPTHVLLEELQAPHDAGEPALELAQRAGLHAGGSSVMATASDAWR